MRPADRVTTPSDKTPTMQAKSFPAPVDGLVTNATFAAGAGAGVLENYWPQRQGVEPRGGSTTLCTVPSAVKAMFHCRTGGQFFVATRTGIYPFSELSAGTLSPVVDGLGGGAWSTYETTTAGGTFLLAVNGVDRLHIFNGTTWQSVASDSAPLALTGVDTRTLSHVWGHRNRVFFVEQGSMSAWYLGVNSVAGPATELPLGGVFRRGGVLVYGATFSSDAGDGMDDRCVFVTDSGEVAIYAGSNPGDANNWSLEGVYGSRHDAGAAIGRDHRRRSGLRHVAGPVPLSGSSRAIRRRCGPCRWPRRSSRTGRRRPSAGRNGRGEVGRRGHAARRAAWRQPALCVEP